MVLNLVPNSRGSAALGTIMNAYRIMSGKSRTEIAELASISQEYLRLIETGRRVPVRTVLGRIAGACGLQPGTDICWNNLPGSYDVSLRHPGTQKVYEFRFVSRIKEGRKTQTERGITTVGVDKLTGKDYMDRSLIELQSHPDFSAHALRVVVAIREMTTEELENLTIAKGPH